MEMKRAEGENASVQCHFGMSVPVVNIFGSFW